MMEGQLTWLVHLVGAIIRGRLSSSSAESQVGFNEYIEVVAKPVLPRAVLKHVEGCAQVANFAVLGLGSWVGMLHQQLPSSIWICSALPDYGVALRATPKLKQAAPGTLRRRSR